MSAKIDIETIVDAVITERVTEATNNATSVFMMKITATGEEDLRAQFKRDPFVWIAAIVAYLDAKNI